MHAYIPRRALAALALALTAACSDASGPGADGAAYAFDLLFHGEDPDGTYLYRVRLTRGPGETLVPSAPERLRGGIVGRMPAPRPDGGAIVYETVDTDVAPARLMYLTPGAAPVPMEDAHDAPTRRPAWSPDGTRLAFSATRDHHYTDIHAGRVVDGRLADVVNLTRGAAYGTESDMTPAWSPDGSLIAFAGYRPHTAIWVMTPTGGAPRIVTPQGEDHGDYFPSWSPDGTRLAFSRNSLQAPRLGIVDAAGGTPRFIEREGSAAAPAWSPDGRYIAFLGGSGEGRDIHVVTPEGTEVARVLRPGADAGAAWLRRSSGW